VSKYQIDKSHVSTKINTIDDLDRIFCNSDFDGKGNSNPDNYKYVIYCRKSTTDEEHQAHSLPDQVLDCTKYAVDHNLKYDKNNIVQEKKSAKESDNRPLFQQVLDDVINGKYDGIICWHPDRLARNMKEAGMIIDLLDKGIIKELKFCSYTYTNDTSGKMNLGITFVLAKQYTDHLSESVRWGNRHLMDEGKLVSHSKHGYFKDKDQYARPDPINWKIIHRAWQLRLQGQTLKDVAKFLNDSGYQKFKKLDDNGNIIYRPFKADEKKVSIMFQDPFYAGLFIHGKQQIILQNIYDFVPVVTPDEFYQLNQHNNDLPDWLKQRIRTRNGQIKADLMRGMITCSGCGRTRSAGITTKKTKTGTDEYLYHKCETKGCPQHNKSINADRVLDYAKNFLETNILPTDKAYDQYIINFEAKRKDQLETLESQRKGLQNQLTRAREKVDLIKETIYKLQNSPESKTLKNEYQNDLVQAMATKESLTIQVESIKDGIEINHTLPMTRDEFLETIKNLPNLLTNAVTLSQKDEIIRKIFSNFTVEGDKVLNHSLNTTYASFLGMIFCNTVGDNRLELLTPVLSGRCSNQLS
jgi:DNA invertase Pin-like site-specific DNA recombinase